MFQAGSWDRRTDELSMHSRIASISWKAESPEPGDAAALRHAYFNSTSIPKRDQHGQGCGADTEAGVEVVEVVVDRDDDHSWKNLRLSRLSGGVGA
jgi:hypothetical protein